MFDSEEEREWRHGLIRERARKLAELEQRKRQQERHEFLMIIGFVVFGFAIALCWQL